MDDQSIVGNDTYQVNFEAGSQFETPERAASARWHTTNSSNTMELERHLSASSVSRDFRANSFLNQSHRDSNGQGSTSVISRQSEGQSYDTGHSFRTSDFAHDSREQTRSTPSVPGYSSSHVFSDSGKHSNLKDKPYDSSEESQPEVINLKRSRDPSSLDPHASRYSDHSYGTSDQDEPAHLMPDKDIEHKYESLRKNSLSVQGHGSNERLDTTYLMSTSGFERRARSPSPKPKVSAETKARWAMLKQLAGVSQRHDEGEGDQDEGSDKEMRTTEADIRIKEEASVRGSLQTDDSADDASIERYLQKLQGDPHIDSRGLQEGLSRMRSYQGSNGRQDHFLAHEHRFENEVHLGARALSDDTSMNAVGKVLSEGGQDARNILHKVEGRAQQTFRSREASLRRDEDALGADLEGAGRRTEDEIRSASSDVRGKLQKDKQRFERDVRDNKSKIDAQLHILGGQTAKEVRRVDHSLEAGFQSAARAVENLLPDTNVTQNLRTGEHDLIEDAHRAEKLFSRTGLGLDVRRDEHDLMEEVHKLEHELPHVGLGQEIRKGEANLVGDIHKIENELANRGLGQEARKVEHQLVDEFHTLEHGLPRPGLDQDIHKEEHDLKQGFLKAADHLYGGEHDLGRGAKAAGRSVEHGLERVKKFVTEGTAIAGGLGMVALDYAGSRNSASNPRPNVPRPGNGTVNTVNPSSQQVPSKIHLGAGVPHPSEEFGPHPAANDRRSNKLSANHQSQPSTVEPPRHPPVPQGLQPGHSRGPSSSQQPHLSPTPSPPRVSSNGPATYESRPEKKPSPSPGSNQRSQVPIRNPVPPLGSQGSPQQRSSTTMPPPSQSRRRQSISQHPPQPQHPRNTQPHPPNTMSQHPQPSHAPSTPQHAQDAIHQHPQAPHAQVISQQRQPASTVPQHPQAAHAQITSQQRQPANATPQHAPARRLQEAPKEGSGIRRPPNAQSPHIRVAPQQPSPGSLPPNPQILYPQGPPQQRSAHDIPHSQSQDTSQQTIPKDQRAGEAQGPGSVPKSNMERARQAPPSPIAGPQPLSNESLGSESKADKEEQRGSPMQERREGVANSQSRLAECQRQQSGNNQDHDAEYYLDETETEHTGQSQYISGPQSMLNMFKVRADAAIEASGERPSFTDRKSYPVLVV